MKKKRLIKCIILLTILVFGGVFIYSLLKTTKTELFDLDREPYYLQSIKEFPSERILGDIPSKEIAEEKAEYVWLEVFGEKVKKEKPYKVFYDEKNELWLVKGSLPRGWKGGVAYIIMQKSNGKVLAVWHDQ